MSSWIDDELYEEIKKVFPLPCTYVIVFWQDEVLLLKRAIELNIGFWSVPGGRIEFGETPEEGARRALKEETGLCMEELHELRTETFLTPGRHALAVVFWVNARNVVRPGHIVLNEESSDYRWCNVYNLPSMMINKGVTLISEAWERENGV